MCLISGGSFAILFGFLFGLGVEASQLRLFYLLATVVPWVIVYAALRHIRVDATGIERRAGPIVLSRISWSELSDVTVAQSGGQAAGQMAMLSDRAGRVCRFGMNWENSDRLVDLARATLDPLSERSRLDDKARISDAAATIREQFRDRIVPDATSGRRKLWLVGPESPGVWVSTSGATLPPVCINCLAPASVLAAIIFFLGEGARWAGVTAGVCFAIVVGSLPACIVWCAIHRPSPRQLAKIDGVDHSGELLHVRFGQAAYAKLTERLNDPDGR